MGIGRNFGSNPMSIYLRTTLLLGTGFLIGVIFTILGMDESGWWQTGTKINPGAALFEADPDEVRSLSYLSEEMTLTAQRSKPGSSFLVQVTFSDDRASQHCVSAPDLAGVLPTLALTKVSKAISHKEQKARYPLAMGRIEVRDAVVGEPISPWLLFGTNTHDVLAVERQSDVFETNIPYEIVRLLRSGCSTMAKR